MPQWTEYVNEIWQVAAWDDNGIAAWDTDGKR